MIFDDRTYSVLLVASSEKMSSSLRSMLHDAAYSPVSIAASAAAAKRLAANRSYDLVIICAPLSDESGNRLACELSSSGSSVCLLIVRSEVYEETHYQVRDSGVFTIQRPISRESFETGLRWMTAARERLRMQERKTVTVEEKMEEIRLVNRAKWLLIDQLKMTEADAHRYIEKQAMDRCVTRREIAEGVIRTYS